jgi:inorganic pyrophosphatase
MAAAMTTLFDTVPPRDPKTGLVNVIVDTPSGSPNKYKFDEALGCFKLSRVLPAGHVFPYDFGSVPRTRAEDGDALDVLVLLAAPTFPGCLVTVRLIGVITAKQTEKGRTIRNDRLVGVPETPVNKPAVRELADLDRHCIEQIEHFFVSYNAAHGRRFQPMGRLGAKKADEMLKKAIATFERE